MSRPPVARPALAEPLRVVLGDADEQRSWAQLRARTIGADWQRAAAAMPRHGYGPAHRRPYTWMTLAAWFALRRTGQVRLRWREFELACVEVTPARATPSTVRVLDPTRHRRGIARMREDAQRQGIAWRSHARVWVGVTVGASLPAWLHDVERGAGARHRSELEAQAAALSRAAVLLADAHAHRGEQLSRTVARRRDVEHDEPPEPLTALVDAVLTAAPPARARGTHAA